MIRLTVKKLKSTTSKHLAAVQKEITAKPTFEAQVKKANSKWNKKTSGKDAKDAFTNIKTTLLKMCVGVEICVYCEINEATDVEHIFPKKMYPEKTFSWHNYVLACKHCNSTYKSDNFKVFNPRHSSTVLDVKLPRKTYLQPPTDDALFINQRVEDPMDFMELDLINGLFIYTPRRGLSSREDLKAQYTINMLGLNDRAALLAGRKRAAQYFSDRLSKYVGANSAKNFTELKKAVCDDFCGVNVSAPFRSEKARIKRSIKEDVQSYSHPSVWKELIRQRANLPTINTLLHSAPEALKWIK